MECAMQSGAGGSWARRKATTHQTERTSPSCSSAAAAATTQTPGSHSRRPPGAPPLPPARQRPRPSLPAAAAHRCCTRRCSHCRPPRSGPAPGTGARRWVRGRWGALPLRAPSAQGLGTLPRPTPGTAQGAWAWGRGLECGGWIGVGNGRQGAGGRRLALEGMGVRAAGSASSMAAATKAKQSGTTGSRRDDAGQPQPQGWERSRGARAPGGRPLLSRAGRKTPRPLRQQNTRLLLQGRHGAGPAAQQAACTCQRGMARLMRAPCTAGR